MRPAATSRSAARVVRGRTARAAGLIPAFLAAFLAAGCGSSTDGGVTGAAGSRPAAPSATAGTALSGRGGAAGTATSVAGGTGSAAAGTQDTVGLQLIVEPDAGPGPLYAFLRAPGHTLDLAMYELVDKTAEEILVNDQRRGVRVRVVLDERREAKANKAAYAYLQANHVEVAWAPPSLSAFHEKAAVADAGLPGEAALVMTLNLTSRYYAGTRDFAVVDRARPDVEAIESVFAADLAGRPPSSLPPGADLVWSPGSQAPLLRTIASARSSLQVENEEMSSTAVVSALSAAARAGASTEVTMTSDPAYRSALARLASAGVGVRLLADSSRVLYIHAKVIVVDSGHGDATAFVGSENFSVASLDRNRELGLFLAEPAIVGTLARTLALDYAAGLPPGA